MAAGCGKTWEQCRNKMVKDYRTEWDESDPLYLNAHQADLMLDDVRTNFDASAEDDTAPRPRKCADAAYFDHEEFSRIRGVLGAETDRWL